MPAVDTYLEDCHRIASRACNRFATLCRKELNGFVESLAYGMRSYLRNGEAEVAFANQKHHIALYILRTDVFESHRAQLSHLSLGKGAIRYRNPAQVDRDVVRAMLRDTATGEVC